MIKYCMVLIALVSLLAGCGKLTKANYDKLKAGMEYDEVVSILGRPDSCSDSILGKGCTWGNEKKNVTVGFIGNKTIVFSSKNLDWPVESTNGGGAVRQARRPSAPAMCLP